MNLKKPLSLFLAIMICQLITAQSHRGLIAKHGMVVSAREEASNIGVKILQQGGNAFDAAIAVQFALAVAYPYAGNIGGGGFMVYRQPYGTYGSLDFREKAPIGASKDMFLDENQQVIPNKSTVGAMAVGVPGSVAGMFAIHEKLGTMAMSKLIQPAIDLAKRGVVVTKKQAIALEKHRDKIAQTSGDKVLLAQKFKQGDTIKLNALARTLEMIREGSKDEFYKGQLAKRIAKFIQDKGGIMTVEDLKKYQAKWRDPIQFDYKDFKITSMGMPSSGGAILAQIMKMIAPYDISKYEHNDEKYIRLIVEAERRAYADRNYFLGDEDFVTVPLDTMLSPHYLRSRMADFSFDKPTPSSEVTHGDIHLVSESDQTTHFSIVDNDGNAVAITTTINGAYGSKLYSEELGFFFNNEMDDFSIKPNVPNMFGLIGAESNSIVPEKRMLSSMTPTIVEKEGKLFMVLGSPGGSTIITSILQTILNVVECQMTMQEAVNAPRFHHQWLPDQIMFETEGFSPKKLSTLEKSGYHINVSNSRIIGKVDAILMLPDGIKEAGADKRGDDTAVGY